MTPTSTRRGLPALFALLLSGASAVLAQNAPTVIRFGSPELGTGARPFPGANPLAVVKARGWLEEEFAKDRIQVEWTFSVAPARRSTKPWPRGSSTSSSSATWPR